MSALREQALASYRDEKEEGRWDEVMNYTEAVLRCCDGIGHSEKSGLDSEKAAETLKNAVPYIEKFPVQIPADEFRANCGALSLAFEKSGLLSEDQVSVLNGFNWNRLTDETVALAGKNPGEFFEAAAADLGANDPEEYDRVVLAGILFRMLRVYLSSTGESMSELIRSQSDITNHAYPTRCPTCGEPAGMAVVQAGSETQGGVRKLFCPCCGTVWSFDRVRCGFCGTTNTNKLHYVHADGDEAHKLHVCEECGGVMPTVFMDHMGDRPFDYDVERGACSMLEAMWLSDQEKNADQEKAE